MRETTIVKVVPTFYGDVQTITFSDGEVIAFTPNSDFGRAFTKGMANTIWSNFEGTKQEFKIALEKAL